jgi:hypothetical protein
VYEIVTGLPDEPVGIWAQAYFTSGYVLAMNGSSQPPSKMIATNFLPRASPHHPAPRSLAVIPRPFLNRSMYHCTAALEAGVSMAEALLSGVRSDPPWA